MPRKTENKGPIRVSIVGSHPWSGSSGVIEAEPGGGVYAHRILGTGPSMYKVLMESGEECFAELRHLRMVKE